MFIEPIFKTTIGKEAFYALTPNTKFMKYIKYRDSSLHSEESLKKVTYFFDKCLMPVPEEDDEFLKGNEGILVFSNKLGLVIRIERKHNPVNKFHRINDNGYILKPIASIDIQSFIIEICPTTKVETDDRKIFSLQNNLKHTQINYWDTQISNMGTIPINTPNFPNGVTVVIDRLSIRKRFGHAIRIKRALEREAEKAQDELYSPLRKAFKEAWNDKSRTPEFFNLCQTFKEQGKLIAGWNHLKDPYFKTRKAIKSAIEYDKRFTQL